MSVKPQKINSVLARFEQTIAKNNEAGVCSGMYLTSLASQNTAPSRRVSVSISMHGKPSSAHQRPPHPRRQSVTCAPGTYRGLMLPDRKIDNNSDSTGSTAGMSSDAEPEWDPFGEKSSALRDKAEIAKRSNDSRVADSSEGSTNSADTFGFDEAVDFDDPFAVEDQNIVDSDPNKLASPKKESKKPRTKDKRGAGRLGNRKTRTKLEAEASRRNRVKAGEGLDEEVKDEGGGGQEDNVFSVTYVSNRNGLSRQGSQRDISSRRSQNSLNSSMTPSRSLGSRRSNSTVESASTNTKSSGTRRSNSGLDGSSTHSSTGKTRTRDAIKQQDSIRSRNDMVPPRPRFRQEGRVSTRPDGREISD
jgi:hypothetical protein